MSSKRLVIGLSILCIGIASCRVRKDGEVFKKGVKITNTNFTGIAYVYPMITADSVNMTDIGNVTFEPGARSKWHQHPGGQILLVTGGRGYYQERGKAKIVLQKGDAIKCPAGVAHWHGASPETSFMQVAVTGREKGPTVWLEAVTDSVYHAGVK